jgi:glycosyltransferase involved in cell wall biosynthesis
MRIALLHDDYPPLHQGGAGVIVHELAKQFLAHGHKVLVLSTVQNKRFAGSDLFEGVEIERMYAHSPERWRAFLSLSNPYVVRQVRKKLAEWKPDVVHAHNVHWHLSYHSLKAAAHGRIPVFLTAHDVMLYHYGKAKNAARISAWELLRSYRFRFNPIRNFIIRRYLRSVTGVIAVSEALQEALEANGIEVRGVIHNGIDVSKWKESKEAILDFKKRYRLGQHVLLFAGRLSGLKGGAVILEMLQHISQSVPDVQLLVLGKKDAYAQRMLATAKEKNLLQRMVFTGWLHGEELHRAYHAASLVVVPSLYLDPFPTVVLEAMAAGQPVVATNLGGARELVVDGETGYIVNPLESAAVIEKLTELLHNPKKCQQFGAAGYRRVSEHFSLASQAKKYEALFSSSIS